MDQLNGCQTTVLPDVVIADTTDGSHFDDWFDGARVIRVILCNLAEKNNYYHSLSI